MSEQSSGGPTVSAPVGGARRRAELRQHGPADGIAAAVRSDWSSRRQWWVVPTIVGVVLLLVPVAALAATNRDPDPLFQHFWWTPIASVPTETLLLGSLGFALLLAAAVAVVATAAVRRLYSHRGAQLIGQLLSLALLVSSIGGCVAVSASRSDVSAAAIRGVLLQQHSPTSVSGQARRAIELALGWPAATTAGVRIVQRSTVPAGPWLVQTTEVLNENLADEGADVTVETLVDPVDGNVEAAWFYGL